MSQCSGVAADRRRSGFRLRPSCGMAHGHADRSCVGSSAPWLSGRGVRHMAAQNGSRRRNTTAGHSVSEVVEDSTPLLTALSECMPRLDPGCVIWDVAVRGRRERRRPQALDPRPPRKLLDDGSSPQPDPMRSVSIPCSGTRLDLHASPAFELPRLWRRDPSPGLGMGDGHQQGAGVSWVSVWSCRTCEETSGSAAGEWCRG